MLDSDKFFRYLEMIVKEYKRLCMLVVFWALNNIIAHNLLTARHGMPSNHYHHQTTKNFKKLLEQEDIKNTLKVAIPIFLTIGMHIGPIKLLKVDLPNAKYNLEEKLRERCIGINWVDDGEIEEAMVVYNNKDNNEKDFWEKNRQLKKKKQYLKQVAVRAKARQQSDQDNYKAAANADSLVSLPLPDLFWLPLALPFLMLSPVLLLPPVFSPPLLLFPFFLPPQVFLPLMLPLPPALL